MNISVKTFITSSAALAVVLFLAGLSSILIINNLVDTIEIDDATRRLGTIQAAVKEDALQNRERANKAFLRGSPDSYFPGITYCDVYIHGDSTGRIIDYYLGEKYINKLTPQKIAGAYLVEVTGVSSTEGFTEYGILRTGKWLIVYGAAPASTADIPSGQQSYILVGKIIDPEYMQKLSRLTGSTVTLAAYDSPDLSAAYIKAKTAMTDKRPVYITKVNEDLGYAYGIIANHTGHPVAIVRIASISILGASGRNLIILAISLILLSGLAVSAANLGGVRIGLARRVGQALDTITKVKDSSDLSKRIAITGNDEMSRLNQAINHMLSHLEESHNREFMMEQLYTKLAEATQSRIMVFGPDMKVEFINSEVSAEFEESPEDVGSPDWVSPVPPEQLKRDREKVKKVFASGFGDYAEEESDFGNEKKWVETWLVPIKDKKNKVIRVLVSSHDITERKKAERKTTRARDFYIYLFDRFPNPVWRVDAKGRCNYVNKAAIVFTGKDEAKLKSGGWETSIHPDDTAGRTRLLEQAAKTRTHTEIEYRLRGHDGTYRWVIDHVQPIYNLNNKFTGFLGTIVDVTERRLKAEELAYMATHDVLTKTANRRRFNEAIEMTVARAKRGETSTLIYLDVDDFKSINDDYGHQEGDKVLAAVARTVKRILRKEDLLARLGGDEFAVILEGQNTDMAVKTAERLADNVNKAVKINGKQNVTISVGLSDIGQKSAVGKVIAEADAAMYEAKRRGGGRALIFESGFLDYNY